MNDLSSTQYSPLGESDEKGVVDHMKYESVLSVQIVNWFWWMYVVCKSIKHVRKFTNLNKYPESEGFRSETNL